MTTRKTTRSTSTTKRTPKQPAMTARAPARRFTLQVGTGFSFITETVSAGEVAASRVPAGATVAVRYWKDPSHPAQPNAVLSRITLHARIDGAPVPSMVVAQRSDGLLLRGAPTLTLPETAKLLEYWFELVTDSGETMWDSNWGNNHWLELAPAHAANEVHTTTRAEA